MTKSYLTLLAMGLIAIFAAAPVAMAEEVTTHTEMKATVDHDTEVKVECEKEVVDGVEVEVDCKSHAETDHDHDAEDHEEAAE